MSFKVTDYTKGHIHFHYFGACDHLKLIILFEKFMKESMIIAWGVDHWLTKSFDKIIIGLPFKKILLTSSTDVINIKGMPISNDIL